MFKVVREYFDDIMSVAYPLLAPEFRMRYTKDILSKPHYGKLFVFNTKENALRYIKTAGGIGIQLWTCEELNAVKADGFLFFIDPISGRLTKTIMTPPDGTFAVDGIKLIERISI